MKNIEPDFVIQIGQHMQKWTNAMDRGMHLVSP